MKTVQNCKNSKGTFGKYLLRTFLVLLVIGVNISCRGCRENAGLGGVDSDVEVGFELSVPTVSLTNPVDGASNIPINRTLTASFNQEMSATTINLFSFTLTSSDGTAVAGTVVLDSTRKIATFTPGSDLDTNSAYTATITTEAQDLEGNALASDYVWEFTTGVAADTTAPTVSFTNPANLETGVAINHTIIATFSETMQPLTLTALSFIVTGPDGLAVLGSVGFDITSRIVTFTPEMDLDQNTIYTATLTTVAQDLAANALASDYVWEFTTDVAADVTAPTVSLTNPADLETDVAINQAVAATFSEAMQPLTLTTLSFTLTGPGATPVDGSVVYALAGSIATFTPDTDFDTDALYTATITTVAKDLAGNALEANYIWEFTTGAAADVIAPTVTATNPEDGDLSVALNKTISATFDEDMTALTITTENYTVTGPGPTPIAGTVDYNVMTNVATFTPGSNFAPDTTFVATISTGAEDLAGNPLEDDYVWSFTTGTEEAQTVMQDLVPLGSAFDFAILASAAITNIPTSMITGDIGLTPDAGSNISGFSDPAFCPELTGNMYAVDATGPACAVIDPVILADAKDDAESAFINARDAARGTPQAISGNLNGLTLYPGLYESGSSLEISPGGFLYLDAQGDENAIFVIRSATSITTEATSEVVLTKGAKAANVYWTAGSSVTLGTNSIMKGTFIAGTSLSLLTGANLEGRALNQGAAAEAVTLDAVTITVPSP